MRLFLQATQPSVRSRRASSCTARAGESGQSVVEAALALPLFLLALYGIFQYSIIFFTYLNATYACRNVARYASLHSNASAAPVTSAQLKSIVTSELYLAPVITPTVNVSYVTSAFATGSNVVGNFVGVSATWSQTVRLPFTSAAWTFSVSSQDYEVITR